MSNAPLDPPENPYSSPATEKLEGRLPPLQTGLGSLGQEARLKQLNTAKWIMIVIAILTIGVNSFLLANADREMDQALDAELKKEGLNRAQVDPVMFQQAKQEGLKFVRIIYGGLIALGAAYIVMGLLVKRFPVPLTVAALVLYVGSALFFAWLEPMTLAQGVIIKIFIVIGLVKAVQAAIAYEREKRMEVESQFA